MKSARSVIFHAHLRFSTQLGIAPAMNAAAESIAVWIPSQSITANTTTLVASATTDPIAYRVILPAYADSRTRV